MINVKDFNMHLISVIVPVYNVEDYLLRCVNSIQNQTYNNLEIILVDDESPDKCPEICDDLAREDPRIKVIHKKNGGLGFARNSGLEIVTGDYVTFIDSDDWIDETHIENLYNAIAFHNADLVIGGHTAVYANDDVVLYPTLLEEKLYEADEIKEQILLPLVGPDLDYKNDLQVNASSCMNLYKMQVIRENNIKFISERFAVSEDLYFNIDFLYNAKFVVATDNVGYFYFENQNSISRKFDKEFLEKIVNYFNYVNEQLDRYHLLDNSKFRVYRTYLMRVRVAIRQIIVSNMKFRDKIREIKKFLNNDITKLVLEEYPIERFIPSIRILVKMMKKSNVLGIYFLMKARLIAKNSAVLSGCLKKIGIGR